MVCRLCDIFSAAVEPLGCAALLCGEHCSCPAAPCTPGFVALWFQCGSASTQSRLAAGSPGQLAHQLSLSRGEIGRDALL